MLIRPPLWYRALIGFGALLFVPMLWMSVVELKDGEAGVHGAFKLFVSVYMFLYFGWMSYLAWLRPAVRIDSRILQWRPGITWKYQRIDLDSIASCRMQDSYDLRLKLKTGDERSLHMSHMSTKERLKLVEKIRKVTIGSEQ
jgi:hypothetical protein